LTCGIAGAAQQGACIVVKSIVAAAVASFALAMSPSAQSQPSSLEGTWQVTEVTTTGPNAATTKKPQPGMYMFTGKHYSILTSQGDQPRPEIAGSKVATATADELRAAWGSFTANAGTYELSGDTLTLRVLIAKNQGFAKSGNFRTFSVKRDGKTLTLVSKASDAGPSTNPGTVKLTRLD
jgi:hypothetical protein